MNEHPLITFLRARYEEREGWARAAVSYSPNWHTEVAREDPYDESRACVRGGLGEVITDGIPAKYADHIEENDPAYVLADIAAKRKILDAWPDPFGNWSADQAEAALAMKAHVLRLLAEPYVDHPEFPREAS